MNQSTRRNFMRDGFLLTGASAIAPRAFAMKDPAEPYRTPYKYPELLLRGTGRKGDFDEIAVDDPIVFRANGTFYMLYIGFDGTGYQTGLARSKDLLRWERVALVGARDPASKWTKYNLAISSILRDKRLDGPGDALKHDGKYLAAWNAYPGAGYESGAAVIGLATSSDLQHWQLTEPILMPQDGAPWEHGGLYRPDLLRAQDGTFFLYYNAKTDTLPKSEGGGWREQSGVATSRDLLHWTRYANNPILSNGPRDSDDGRFASNPYVVTHSGGFGMYYFGFGYTRPGRAKELLALGADPYHFTKVPQPLIEPGAPGTIDETFAHKPSIIFHDGALYHFYCAVSGKWPNELRGIAVARSKPW
ncbi:Predicted glycosyl hydrolase, GH43/DUF377 family [Bryocella elongata]|uniref:Predicted glycosyl hydrolase, GH43/DUF377 family n=1 Tax=Bryocella elongata TaxID=863522 RepID=A0A1H6AX01_9BACT|nr:hypothetical protein [Bryocella elongata]SEG52864.1 Predicted glycosyl hydrolase, GH43/DUF377 family [Bryocella elongata]